MMRNDHLDNIRSQMLYDATRKSTGLAYVLWFFLGNFGAHRFYADKTGSAIAQLVLGIVGWLTIWLFGLGLLFLVPLWIWVLIDAFLIPGWLQSHNLALVDRLTPR